MGILGSSDKQLTPAEIIEAIGGLDLAAIRELEEFKEAAEGIAKARRVADAITGDIDSAERYSEATDAMKFLDDAGKDAEAARKKVKKPIDEAAKRVQAALVELKESVKPARQSLEDRCLAYERERKKQERERREAEEAEARKAEALAKQEGDEEAARHHREEVDRATAPRAEVSGARGATGAKSSPTDELKYEIVDEAALPDEYVKRVPDRAKILADVRKGCVIAGVRTYRDEKMRVR